MVPSCILEIVVTVHRIVLHCKGVQWSSEHGRAKTKTEWPGADCLRRKDYEKTHGAASFDMHTEKRKSNEASMISLFE